MYSECDKNVIRLEKFKKILRFAALSFTSAQKCDTIEIQSTSVGADFRRRYARRAEAEEICITKSKTRN